MLFLFLFRSVVHRSLAGVSMSGAANGGAAADGVTPAERVALLLSALSSARNVAGGAGGGHTLRRVAYTPHAFAPPVSRRGVFASRGVFVRRARVRTAAAARRLPPVARKLRETPPLQTKYDD